MAITETFHIMPWDQGRLTVGDLVGAIETIEARNAEAKKARDHGRS